MTDVMRHVIRNLLTHVKEHSASLPHVPQHVEIQKKLLMKAVMTET